MTNTDYQNYQLQWMRDHAYSLEDLVMSLEKYRQDTFGLTIPELFEEWEFNQGFDGEIWTCEDEFEDCEAQENQKKKRENMYRIKMLCYDDQNQMPYEDVSLECYKTEQDAKNAAIQAAVQEVSELNIPDVDNNLPEKTYLVSTYTDSDACYIRSEYREDSETYPLTEYYIVPENLPETITADEKTEAKYDDSLESLFESISQAIDSTVQICNSEYSDLVSHLFDFGCEAMTLIKPCLSNQKAFDMMDMKSEAHYWIDAHKDKYSGSALIRECCQSIVFDLFCIIDGVSSDNDFKIEKTVFDETLQDAELHSLWCEYLSKK